MNSSARGKKAKQLSTRKFLWAAVTHARRFFLRGVIGWGLIAAVLLAWAPATGPFRGGTEGKGDLVAFAPSSPHAPRRWGAAGASVTEPQPLDVEHYRIELSLFPEANALAGTVTITGRAIASTPAIKIDAADNLAITEVLYNGSPWTFTRTAEALALTFPPHLAKNDSFTLTISYRGQPRIIGRLGSGMFISSHSGFPVIATLSEPYGAPTWWPCIDNPADKATAEIIVTVPSGYIVASNGLLQSMRLNPDGTLSYIWQERYPIATYLISVTATNFTQFSDTYRALDSTTTMPIVFYVYPEHVESARRNFAPIKDAIRIFAEMFGEYPFLTEKYGMAEFPWGGAMEHQTITSIGQSLVTSPNPLTTLVHELAHHWWGDMVTMKTWNDIWLNEGFATYSEVLFYEKRDRVHPGSLMRRYDDGRADGILQGTVYAEDATDPWDDYWAIYNKGAWVLHMLRHVVGDETFFAALREYGRRFAYANASTDDLNRVFSEFYGQSLDWFFQQWIYAPGRPIYSLSTTITPGQQTYELRLRLEQKQTHTIPGRQGAQARVYIMPLDLTIHYVDGTSEIKRVWNDARVQEFHFTTTKEPTSITLDDENWLLKEIVPH